MKKQFKKQKKVYVEIHSLRYKWYKIEFVKFLNNGRVLLRSTNGDTFSRKRSKRMRWTPVKIKRKVISKSDIVLDTVNSDIGSDELDG